MTAQATEAAALIGDNVPPEKVDPLLVRLRDDHADLIERRDELLGGIGRTPDVIVDEETAGTMADFVNIQIAGFLKNAKAVHGNEKSPFLSAGRTVDSFLHTLIDDIEKGKARLNVIRKKFADEKAAKERRRLEEEARVAREEAARLEREAAEQAAAITRDADLAAAVEAEEKAEQAKLDAEKAAKEAAAKPAVLGRSRGEYGGMTSLKQFWDFADLDRDVLDLEALREHLPLEALEKAIRSFIKAGGREIDGARIFENTRL